MSHINEFLWHGHDRQGHPQSGMVRAKHPALARLELHRQGIRVANLKQQPHTSSFRTPADRKTDSGQSLPAERKRRLGITLSRSRKTDVVIFYQQLATLLRAGLPILRALTLTADSLPSGQLPTIARELAAAIEEGTSLADAMSAWPRTFDSLSVNLIRTGESAGMLDTAVQRVADAGSRAAQLRNQVRSAMTYPLAVLATAVLVCGLLLTQLVPQFSATFQNLGAELPTLTQSVVTLSQWTLEYGAVLLLGTVAVSFITVRLWRHQPALQHISDRTLLILPILAPIVRSACLARIFHTLAITLEAGIPLLDALRAAAGVADNHAYQHAVSSLADEIQQGQRLGAAVRLNPLFPVMMAQLIDTGEESGTLDTMLAKCADICERQVEQSVGTLTRLMEPAIMAVLGVLTGTLMLAMYLPIFQLGAVL